MQELKERAEQEVTKIDSNIALRPEAYSDIKEAKYRSEYKHILNKGQAIVLKSRLRAIMKPDEHADENGEYFIRSLYFDTYSDKDLGEKRDSVPYREKFRIRFYNHDTSMIRLENKIKRFNSCLKISCALTKEEVIKILNKDYDFLKESNEPIKHKFYRDLVADIRTPKTITDYIRTPFVSPLGNTRITIDSDLRSPTGGLMDFFNPHSPTISVFPDERCVLEVKYDEYIPDHIYKLIQQVDGSRTSAMSKYAACRKFL